MKLIFALVIGLVAGFAFHFRCRPDELLFNRRDKSGALVEPLLLPLYLAVIIIMWVIMLGTSSAAEKLFASLAALFLYIGLYFCVLLCVLPLLRRFISAKACATLWLLPNLMYYTVYLDLGSRRSLFVVTLPREWLGVVALVWLGGFVLVMLWQLISHLTWRRYLLRGARKEEEAQLLSLWDNERQRCSLRREIPVYRSANTQTPVSVGLFSRTLRLVLPERSYDNAELRLILRHEMQHIWQRDIQTKAFLGFCTAMCWFNPFVWLARRRVSEDLELKCDEAVLIGEDESQRGRYAHLLLNTTGNSRGCTTCLSASAKAMRYRLKSITGPKRRFSGAAAVGLAMTLLILGSGTLAIADSGGTVQELVFDRAPADIAIESVTTATDEPHYYRGVYGWDEAALTEYIASLHVKKVYSGNIPEQGRGLYLYYEETQDGEVISGTRIELCDGRLRANIPYDDENFLVYIIQDELDWDYIDSLIDYEAPDPDPAPQPPWLMLYFDAEEMDSDRPLYPARRYLHVEQAGEVLDYSDRNDESVGGVDGIEVSRVRLEFSYAPAAGYVVTVEGLGGEEPYTLTDADCPDGVLELAPYSALYTVSAGFVTVRETSYDMEFVFEVVLPE